jgi:hypothetical protein
MLLIPCMAVAAPSLSPAQEAAICGKRVPCKLVAIHNAGKLQVAEVLFGIKNRPDDAPDEGCKTADGNDPRNGGTEYWLLAGAKPLKVLALCNDGYGSADVGEDSVTFANNRLTHVENGGSAWRWDNTDVYSLSPFRMLSQQGCSFNDLGGNNGTVTDVDFIKFRAVTISKNPAANWKDGDVGCPETTPAMFAVPKAVPGNKLVASLPVLTPADGNSAFKTVPVGTTLDSCSTSLTTDGRAGFLTFGTAAGGASAAEMRVLAPTSQILMLQIYDPLAAAAPAGKSWISGAHAEIWLGNSSGNLGVPKRSDMGQVAVDLDGTVHVVGKTETPHVDRWPAKDEKGRAVTVLLLHWQDDNALPLGVAVSYSQAQNGRQARLVTTTAMARGVPLFVPSAIGMQTKCAIRSGRFETL